MRLNPLLYAKDTILCLLKNVPVVGTAVEVVQTVTQRYEQLLVEDRLNRLEEVSARVEQEASDFSRKYRDLVISSLAEVMQELRSPAMDGNRLAHLIRSLRDIKEQGWQPALFEGLLGNSLHWEAVQAHPQNYGEVLQDQGQVDPTKIQILIDADKQRVLQVTPFAFQQLLANQKAGAQPAVVAGQDVWAFPHAAEGLAVERSEQAPLKIISYDKAAPTIQQLTGTLIVRRKEKRHEEDEGLDDEFVTIHTKLADSTLKKDWVRRGLLNQGDEIRITLEEGTYIVRASDDSTNPQKRSVEIASGSTTRLITYVSLSDNPRWTYELHLEGDE